MASSSLRISLTLQYTSPHNEPFAAVTQSRNALSSYPSTHQPPSRALTCSSSRRRGKSSGTGPVTPKIAKKKNLPSKKNVEEDAFEALFRQLEEDLKNDELNGGEDDEEISEEEMAKLEQELAEALAGDDELMASFESLDGGEVDDDGEEEEDDGFDDDFDEDDEDEEEEMPVKLKSWQMRRLAYALKNGRRKTKIKDLAAELGLDRAYVLNLLRDPPPSLVLMSGALPDKPVSVIPEPVTVEEPVEIAEAVEEVVNPEVEKKLPVHVMQSNWTARKRLKKVQVETLERVYNRSKRPTNAMVSSIVHVTNLPRKKVVKWFEDKRAEDGVPENRVPYLKPAAPAETVFTS